MCCMDDYITIVQLFEVVKEDIHFDLTKNNYYFDIKLQIDCIKGCDIKQCIQYETYQNEI